jgi:membrane protein YqaA with SNARE-associated domain
MWPLSKNPDLMVKGHVFFERWGVWAIVLERFWGPLRASIPIVAGIVEMPWLRVGVPVGLRSALARGGRSEMVVELATT